MSLAKGHKVSADHAAGADKQAEHVLSLILSATKDTWERLFTSV